MTNDGLQDTSPCSLRVDGGRGSYYLIRQHTRASPCAFVFMLSLRLNPSTSLLALGITVLPLQCPSCWPSTRHLLGVHCLLRSKKNRSEESLCFIFTRPWRRYHPLSTAQGQVQTQIWAVTRISNGACAPGVVPQFCANMNSVSLTCGSGALGRCDSCGREGSEWMTVPTAHSALCLGLRAFTSDLT